MKMDGATLRRFLRVAYGAAEAPTETPIRARSLSFHRPAAFKDANSIVALHFSAAC